MSQAEKKLKEIADEGNGCVDFSAMVFNYGRFHQDRINRLIHVVGIPLIAWSIFNALIFLAHSESVAGQIDRLPLFEEPVTPLAMDKYSFVATACSWLPLTVAYLIADLGVGTVWALWSLPAALSQVYLYNNHRDDEFFGMSQVGFFLVLQGAAWIAQFIGHALFEKRAPALVSNLGFALLAPFFETFLLMHQFAGYKEGERLQKVFALIDEDIAEYRAAKGKDDSFKRE